MPVRLSPCKGKQIILLWLSYVIINSLVMIINNYLLVNMHSLYAALSAAQTCPLYIAGITSTTEGTSTTTSAVYVNANSAYDAECDGTVYAWHYCYYATNSQTDLEAAFGVFSVSSGVYSLREGSYYLLHLDTRETSFTCDSVTLNSSQYFQIHNGDTVGACLRDNGDIDYLDILFDTDFFDFNFAATWERSSGACTEDVMQTSPSLTYRSNNLHLYVDISEFICTMYASNS